MSKKLDKDPILEDDLKFDTDMEDISFDSDFDDIDVPFDENDSDKERKPVQKTSNITKKLKAARAATSEGVGKGITAQMKKALPHTAELADKIKNNDLLNGSFVRDTASELRPLINQAKKSSRQLIKYGEDIIPKGLYNKIVKKLDNVDDDGGSYKPKSKEEVRRDTISSDLSEIFKVQMEAEHLYKGKEAADKIMDRNLSTKHHDETITVLQDTRNQSMFLTSFLRSTFTGYMKKSLELKYKHLYVAEDTFESLRVMSGMLESKLDAIRHNTALPDSQKIYLTEMAKRALGQKFVGGFADLVANYTSRVKDKIKEQWIDPAKDMLGSSADLMDGLADGLALQEEMGDKLNPKGSAGKFLGRMLGKGIGTLGMKKALSKLPKETLSIVENYAQLGGQGLILLLEQIRRGELTFKGSDQLSGVLDSILPDLDRTAGKFDSMVAKNPNEPGAITKRFTTTVEQIIPGFLSLQTKWLEQIATGRQAEALAFDFDKGKLVTANSLRESWYNKAYGTEEQRGAVLKGNADTVREGLVNREDREKAEATFEEIAKEITIFMANLANAKRWPRLLIDDLRELANTGDVNYSTWTKTAFRGIKNPQEVASGLLSIITKPDGSIDANLVSSMEVRIIKTMRDLSDKHRRAIYSAVNDFGQGMYLEDIVDGKNGRWNINDTTWQSQYDEVDGSKLTKGYISTYDSLGAELKERTMLEKSIEKLATPGTVSKIGKSALNIADKTLGGAANLVGFGGAYDTVKNDISKGIGLGKSLIDGTLGKAKSIGKGILDKGTARIYEQIIDSPKWYHLRVFFNEDGSIRNNVSNDELAYAISKQPKLAKLIKEIFEGTGMIQNVLRPMLPEACLLVAKMSEEELETLAESSDPSNTFNKILNDNPKFKRYRKKESRSDIPTKKQFADGGTIDSRGNLIKNTLGKVVATVSKPTLIAGGNALAGEHGVETIVPWNHGAKAKQAFAEAKLFHEGTKAFNTVKNAITKRTDSVLDMLPTKEEASDALKLKADAFRELFETVAETAKGERKEQLLDLLKSGTDQEICDFGETWQALKKHSEDSWLGKKVRKVGGLIGKGLIGAKNSLVKGFDKDYSSMYFDSTKPGIKGALGSLGNFGIGAAKRGVGLLQNPLLLSLAFGPMGAMMAPLISGGLSLGGKLIKGGAKLFGIGKNFFGKKKKTEEAEQLTDAIDDSDVAKRQDIKELIGDKLDTLIAVTKGKDGSVAGDADGDGDRDGGWKDFLQKKKERKEKQKEKQGMWAKLRSKAKGLMPSFLKKKLGGDDGGGMGGGLIGTLLGMGGKALLGRLGIGAALSAGGAALMSGITGGLSAAAGFLISNPLGWAILAGVGLYGAYKIWKWKTSDSKIVAEWKKERFTLYGCKEDEDIYKAVTKLEERVREIPTKGELTDEELEDFAVDMDLVDDGYVFGIFGGDDDALVKKKVEYFKNWYLLRMRPIYTIYLEILSQYAGKPADQIESPEDIVNDDARMSALSAFKRTVLGKYPKDLMEALTPDPDGMEKYERYLKKKEKEDKKKAENGEATGIPTKDGANPTSVENNGTGLGDPNKQLKKEATTPVGNTANALLLLANKTVKDSQKDISEDASMEQIIQAQKLMETIMSRSPIASLSKEFRDKYKGQTDKDIVDGISSLKRKVYVNLYGLDAKNADHIRAIYSLEQRHASYLDDTTKKLTKAELYDYTKRFGIITDEDLKTIKEDEFNKRIDFFKDWYEIRFSLVYELVIRFIENITKRSDYYPNMPDLDEIRSKLLGQSAGHTLETIDSICGLQDPVIERILKPTKEAYLAFSGSKTDQDSVKKFRDNEAKDKTASLEKAQQQAKDNESGKSSGDEPDGELAEILKLSEKMNSKQNNLSEQSQQLTSLMMDGGLDHAHRHDNTDLSHSEYRDLMSQRAQETGWSAGSGNKYAHLHDLENYKDVGKDWADRHGRNEIDNLDLSNLKTPELADGGQGDLGTYVKKFESGNKGPSAIGYDRNGGTSYGTYQFASRVGALDEFLAYAKTNGGEFGRRLYEEMTKIGNFNTGSKSGDAVNVWKKFAEVDNGKALYTLERAYIQKKYYQRALDAIQIPEAKELVMRDRGLQEALWSTAVQHGQYGDKGAPGIFSKTFKKDITPAEWLKAIYSDRSNRFGSSTAAIQKSAMNRFKSELPIVLALSKAGGGLTDSENAAMVSDQTGGAGPDGSSGGSTTTDSQFVSSLPSAGDGDSGTVSLPGPAIVGADGVVLPSPHNVITSPFGKRNVKGGSKDHKGIDLRAYTGEPIMAMKDGTVEMAGGQYGTVVLNHGDNLKSRYLHLSRFNTKAGTKVRAGDVIGFAGGRGPNGPTQYDSHLHFDVIRNGNYIDPEAFLKASKIDVVRKGQENQQAPMSDVGTSTETPGVQSTDSLKATDVLQPTESSGIGTNAEQAIGASPSSPDSASQLSSDPQAAASHVPPTAGVSAGSQKAEAIVADAPGVSDSEKPQPPVSLPVDIQPSPQPQAIAIENRPESTTTPQISTETSLNATNNNVTNSATEPVSETALEELNELKSIRSILELIEKALNKVMSEKPTDVKADTPATKDGASEGNGIDVEATTQAVFDGITRAFSPDSTVIASLMSLAQSGTGAGPKAKPTRNSIVDTRNPINTNKKQYAH